MLKNILIKILICLSLLTYGCSNNSFDKNTLKAGDILKHAYNLEKTSKTENIVKDGKVIVRIYSKKEKSNKYLIKNREKLFSLYKRIRPVADVNNSEYYYEALFICATINQSLFMLSGESFEDVSKMIGKIRGVNSIDLADWVVNGFYGKLEVPENLLQDWILMEKSKKIGKIYDGIILNYGNELIIKGKFDEAEQYYKQLKLLSENTEIYRNYALEVIDKKRELPGNP